MNATLNDQLVAHIEELLWALRPDAKRSHAREDGAIAADEHVTVFVNGPRRGLVLLDGVVSSPLDLACRFKPGTPRDQVAHWCELTVAQFEEEARNANAPPCQQNAAPGGEPEGGCFDERGNDGMQPAGPQALISQPLHARLFRFLEVFLSDLKPSALRREGHVFVLDERFRVVVAGRDKGRVVIDGLRRDLIDLVAAVKGLTRREAINNIEQWLAGHEEFIESASEGAGSDSATPEQNGSGELVRDSHPGSVVASQARLASVRGWIKLPKVDLALLNQKCGGSASTTFVVWVALLCIANQRQSAKFQVSMAEIQSGAGVSLRTTKTAIYRLQALGFLKIEHHYDPRTKKNDPNTFTLLRSCNHYTTPSRKDCITPSGNNCTRGGAMDGGEHLHRSAKKGAKAPKIERIGARRPSADAEGALPANARNSGPRSF